MIKMAHSQLIAVTDTGAKRSGIHISLDDETRELLRQIQIRNLTFVSASDILKLGCQAWISLHGKGLIKGTYNELSTNQEQTVVCVLEDREPERNVVPIFDGQPCNDCT
jgi:S-adenosylmethionine:diacylglycerol 3-amino-3-carboxypropyl transferase